MNELQQAAIDNLQKSNLEFISILAELKSQITLEYAKYDDLNKEFMDLMTEMELASGQLPFVPYNNAYSFRNDNFCRASVPLINDSLYGTINKEYVTLSDDWMDEISSDFEEKFSELRSVLHTYVKKLDSVLQDIIACNSITQKLEGLQVKYNELESVSKVMWYPKELSKRDYAMKGQYIPPIMLSPAQIQMRNPFHRELLIKYDYLLKTKEIHPNAIDKCIGVLKYINSYLPFAELVTDKGSTKVVFSNINMPNQNQIGSNNTFDGNINIGK